MDGRANESWEVKVGRIEGKVLVACGRNIRRRATRWWFGVLEIIKQEFPAVLLVNIVDKFLIWNHLLFLSIADVL
jgi:hypothetical protein